MIEFKQINNEYPIIEAAKVLGLEGDYRLHERSPEDWRCKSVFNPGDGDDVTSIDSVKNNWYDHKELRGGGVLELWALVRYGSCDDIECKKRAAQDINDLAGGIFSKGAKNSPAPNIKANSKAMRLKSDFRRNVEKWHELLMSDNPDAVKAREYLHSRKINDDTIRKYKLGLCVQSVRLEQKNSEGKIFESETRLAIPYFNMSNEAVYLITRRLDWLAVAKNLKYMKTVRTKDIDKERITKEELDSYFKNCPMGLNTIPLSYKERQYRDLIIGEGVIDFLTVVQEGYSALFSAGGAFGEENDKRVIEEALKFNRVVTVFDGDEAGIKFTYRFGKMLMEAEIPFSIVDFYGEGNKDVSDYYTAGGSIPELIDKARNGYIFMAEQLYIQEFNRRTYYRLHKDEKGKMTTAVKQLLKGLTEMANPEEISQVKEVIKKYYPEDLLKQAEAGPSKAEKYKEQILQAREIFLRSNPDLLYTGSVKHGEYYGYNKEAHYWQRLTDANIQSRIAATFAYQELPKTIRDITDAVRMRVTCDERPEFNTQPLFGFKNGVLELDTGKFREHRPTDYLTFQVAYNYNASAECPRFDKFIQEVTDGNQSRVNFLDDMMAYTLYHDCRLEKVFFLIGSGRNGKSVFLHILEALFKNANKADTSQSVTHIQPKDFQDPTKRIMLSKSILNIAYDIDYNLRGSESYLKSIASGDVIDGNYKFCDTEHFTSRAKIISSCNHMPVLRDSSEGMTRRPMFCKFGVDFSGREDKRLKDKIITEELPGIFNRVFKAYQDLIKRDEIRESDDQQEFMSEFKEIANPMLVFWENESTTNLSRCINQKDTITKKELYEHYKTWCENNKRKHVLASNIFHKEFKRTIKSLDNVELNEIRVRNGAKQVYEYEIKINFSQPQTIEAEAVESNKSEAVNIDSQESSLSESEASTESTQQAINYDDEGAIDYEDYMKQYADYTDAEESEENNPLHIDLSTDENEL